MKCRELGQDISLGSVYDIQSPWHFESLGCAVAIERIGQHQHSHGFYLRWVGGDGRQPIPLIRPPRARGDGDHLTLREGFEVALP